MQILVILGCVLRNASSQTNRYFLSILPTKKKSGRFAPRMRHNSPGRCSPSGDQGTLQVLTHQICVTALLLGRCELRRGSKIFEFYQNSSKILAYCLKKFGIKNTIENLSRFFAKFEPESLPKSTQNRVKIRFLIYLFSERIFDLILE